MYLATHPCYMCESATAQEIVWSRNVLRMHPDRIMGPIPSELGSNRQTGNVDLELEQNA